MSAIYYFTLAGPLSINFKLKRHSAVFFNENCPGPFSFKKHILWVVNKCCGRLLIKNKVIKRI